MCAASCFDVYFGHHHACEYKKEDILKSKETLVAVTIFDNDKTDYNT
jgi:hypothetical protein